jgi:hypothetical protein
MNDQALEMEFDKKPANSKSKRHEATEERYTTMSDDLSDLSSSANDMKSSRFSNQNQLGGGQGKQAHPQVSSFGHDMMMQQ